MKIHYVYNFIMNELVSICYQSESLKQIAIEFAEKHNLKLCSHESASTLFSLIYQQDGVLLFDNETQTSIKVDFTSGSLAHRQKYGGGKGQTIAKAIGMKKADSPITILDVTAGLAKDAFVFACLGCKVTMLERHPIIAELVRDAINQARNAENFIAIFQQGFSLIQTDALDYLTNLNNNSKASRPDVIYLDPMYPERKKSAAVKKNMQFLQKLTTHYSDKNESTLLPLALECATKRVVVKRPKGAPHLTSTQPTLTYESKITRYDVYICTTS